MNPKNIAAYFVAVCALTGCASAPKHLQGEYSDLSPEQVSVGSALNERVRWGGLIIATMPKDQETCIEVLSRDLSASTRPVVKDTSNGRFIACRNGFYDPAVFSNTREITVVGTVRAIVPGQIGELTYQYPKVEADTIHLWPEYKNDYMYLSPQPGSWFWGFGHHNLRIHHVRVRGAPQPKPEPLPSPKE